MTTQNTLIAGRHGGKSVYVAPAVQPKFELLRKKSLDGNHWARLAVLGLTNLASGRLGKDNIFVKPNKTVDHGKEEFFVFLPGCKAFVERLPDDSYLISDLVVDSGYFEMNSQNSMTGLYAASKQGSGAWEVEFLEKGRLAATKTQDGFIVQRIVGVADGNYRSANDAASAIAPLVVKAPRGADTAGKRFDLHFTGLAKRKRIGGLVNYSVAVNPCSASELHGSAQLLADAMSRARKVEGMNWVAEQGGSAVLTQAMQILVNQGVKLPKHSAFLFRPRTSPNEAVKLAHKLGMDLDRNFSSSLPTDIIGNRDQLEMAWNRFRSEKNYRAGNLVSDHAKAIGNVHGFVAGAMTTAAYLAVPAMPIFPALLSIGTIFGKALVAAKVADQAVETVAPSFYHRHIGKIK